MTSVFDYSIASPADETDCEGNEATGIIGEFACGFGRQQANDWF